MPLALASTKTWPPTVALAKWGRTWTATVNAPQRRRRQAVAGRVADGVAGQGDGVAAVVGRRPPAGRGA